MPGSGFNRQNMALELIIFSKTQIVPVKIE